MDLLNFNFNKTNFDRFLPSSIQESSTEEPGIIEIASWISLEATANLKTRWGIMASSKHDFENVQHPWMHFWYSVIIVIPSALSPPQTNNTSDEFDRVKLNFRQRNSTFMYLLKICKKLIPLVMRRKNSFVAALETSGKSSGFDSSMSISNLKIWKF